MTKPANPFGDFDFSRIMGDFKMGGPEMERLVASQKRNLEAITEANRAAAACFQAIVQRQSDLMRDAMTEASSAVKDLSGADNPEARAKRQADMVKSAFERAVATMKDIAEMAAKSNAEIYEKLTERALESMAEIKDAAQASAEKAKKK